MAKVKFPDDVNEDLLKAADTSRQPPVEWYETQLPVKSRKAGAKKAKIDRKTPAKPKSMADVLGDFIGCVKSSGKMRLSENGSEEFTDYLVKKQKVGHL